MLCYRVIISNTSARFFFFRWLRMMARGPVRCLYWVGETESEESAVRSAREAWNRRFVVDDDRKINVTCEKVESSRCNNKIVVVERTWLGQGTETHSAVEGRARELWPNDRGYIGPPDLP